jgi:hypothetical protein
MVEIARRMAHATRLPLLIQPNAGLPETRDGKVVYPTTPAPSGESSRGATAEPGAEGTRSPSLPLDVDMTPRRGRVTAA